jgi:hypothetical protein
MKMISKFALNIFAMAAVASAAHAYPSDFVGTWVNVNSSSSGIIRLVITPDLKLRAFGQCHPTPCDIGITQLWTYGKTVSDKNHRAATGQFGLSFKDIQVVAKLQSNRMMSVEDYNYFSDSSGRQNYWNGQRFRKLPAAEERAEFPSTSSEPEN